MATVRAKGVITFNPNEKAPDFVLGTITISINQLKDWMEGEGKDYVTYYKNEPQIKLQVTKPKEGRGIMVAVDTWKPVSKNNSETVAANQKRSLDEDKRKPFNANADDQSDLPF